MAAARGRRRLVNLTWAATVCLYFGAQRFSASPSPLIDYMYKHKQTPLQNYTEFCGPCRFDPNADKWVTCQDRADYFVKKYGSSPEGAVKEVMNLRPDYCRISRYNLTELLPSKERSARVSMFAESRPEVIAHQSTRSADLLSIFIYTLPNEVGAQMVDEMRLGYSNGTYTYENFKSDIAIIDLFGSYPKQTRDPNEADLFVVPYPHSSHCVWAAGQPGGTWMHGCRQVSAATLHEKVFSQLVHYRGNERRHIFINTMETFHTHATLRQTPFALTIGPREKSMHIVVPYVNDDPSYQPSVIRGRGPKWWTRPRKFSVAYYFGSRNMRMKKTSQRKFRQYFLEEVRTNWTSSPYLGGLPYIVEDLSSGGYNDDFFSEVYRNSIFCPALPGDAPTQKRFFDVAAMARTVFQIIVQFFSHLSSTFPAQGCIPVVLSFPTGNGTDVSWHAIDSPYTVWDSFPFAKGSRSIAPEHEIDYESFVVQVDGGVGNIKPTLESIMRNATDLRRRQMNLMRYAPLFLYGMGKESHRYDDAFTQILRSIEFALGNLT